MLKVSPVWVTTPSPLVTVPWIVSAFTADRPVLNAPNVRAAAAHLGVTPAQVAQAWLLDQGPTVLLISGTSSPAHLEENLAVEHVVLDAEARALLEG